LTLAAILFAYALVGVQVKPEIQYLGVPLIVRRPQLLPFALIVVAAWAMLRFWYYAILLIVSPMHARRRLRNGELPSGDPVPAPGPNGRTEAVDRALNRYYPGVNRRAVVEYKMKSREVTERYPGGGWTFTVTRIPFSTWLLVFGQTLDYTAPLWLTGLAIIAVIVSARWPLTP
jgi:hypothetical protein